MSPKPTIAAQIMNALAVMLADGRTIVAGPDDLPLQPKLERDRVISLAPSQLNSRILNWGPDQTRIQEIGRPPSRRDDPEDRRTLTALLAIRCTGTGTTSAPDVADLCVAWAVKAVCGPPLAGSLLHGLADRVYLGAREPKMGKGDPASVIVVLELLVDYWNLVSDAQSAS